MIAARSISPLFLKFRILARFTAAAIVLFPLFLGSKSLPKHTGKIKLSPLFLQLKNPDRFPAAAIDLFHYSSPRNPCRFTSAGQLSPLFLELENPCQFAAAAINLFHCSSAQKILADSQLLQQIFSIVLPLKILARFTSATWISPLFIHFKNPYPRRFTSCYIASEHYYLLFLRQLQLQKNSCNNNISKKSSKSSKIPPPETMLSSAPNPSKSLHCFFNFN
jgi:hypothetical protein